MVVLEKYYEFVDKRSSVMSKDWKICHISLFVIASLTGLISYYVFNSLIQQFGDNCILYANISFIIKNVSDFITNEENKTISQAYIDLTKTRWGDEELCHFCQYVPIMSMIVGSIFLTFFVMCPRGGSRKGQSGIKRPWHIVLPSLFLTGIFSVIILSSTIITRNGILAFCAEFQSELNTTTCSAELQNYSLQKPTFHSNTLVYIKSLSVLLISCVIAWFAAFIVLFLRCCCAVADFQMIEVTISTVNDYDDDEESHLGETKVLLEPRQSTPPITHV